MHLIGVVYRNIQHLKGNLINTLSTNLQITIMDFINKLLDENYDWGDERIDEDAYDELSAELVIDYLKKHDPEVRQMLALT